MPDSSQRIVPPLPVEDLAHARALAAADFASLQGARILLTGGTGFFGRWLVEALLGAGARLVVVSRDPEAFLASAPHLASLSALEMLRGDVRDFVVGLGEITHVIHAATPASQALNVGDPLAMLDTLIAGTRHALAATGAARVLLVSSGAVYGPQPPDVEHLAEAHLGGPNPLDANSAYGEGKRVSELLGAVAARSGREVVIARPFAFVGPHLPLDVHFAIGNFIRDALERPEIVVGGDGTPYRSYLYASELVAMLIALLVRGESGRAYNVGSEDGRTLGSFAELTARLVGKAFVVRGTPRPGAPTSRYVPSTTRLRSELGIEPQIDVADAIRKTLHWYRHLPQG